MVPPAAAVSTIPTTTEELSSDAPLVTAGIPHKRPLRVGMISNPNSGQNKRRGLLAAIRDVLRAHPQVANAEGDSFDGIVAGVEDLIGREVEVLIVNGGDGTAQAVLTGMLRLPPQRLPLLAVLPGGSTNTTAHNVGYGRRPLAAVQRLLAECALGCLTGHAARRAVMRADFVEGTLPQYAMFFGAGAVYHGVQFYHKQIGSRGVHGQAGAGLALATFLGRVFTGGGSSLFPPLHATVCIDGTAWAPASYFGFLSSTFDRLILNLCPYWGHGPGPLRFSALESTMRHRLRTIPPFLLFGRTSRLRPEFGYRSTNASEIRLRLDSGITLDGELFEPHGPEMEVTLTANRGVHFLREAR